MNPVYIYIWIWLVISRNLIRHDPINFQRLWSQKQCPTIWRWSWSTIWPNPNDAGVVSRTRVATNENHWTPKSAWSDTIRNVVVHVLVLNMWAEFGTKTAAYIIHFTNTQVLGKPKSLQTKRQIYSNLYPTVLFIQHQLHCFHSILDMPWEYLLWTKPDGWVVVDPRIQHIKKTITTTAHLSLSLSLLDVYIYMWFVTTWTHEPSQHSDPYKATALIV